MNSDGNEIGGVPVVLLDAPLATYLGWNITATGFHKDKLCTYAGGMIPFAQTHAERIARGDRRPSLEERYRDHAGYVAAVRKATANAMAQGFLLQKDADALIAAAEASSVLRSTEAQAAASQPGALTRCTSRGVPTAQSRAQSRFSKGVR